MFACVLGSDFAIDKNAERLSTGEALVAVSHNRTEAPSCSPSESRAAVAGITCLLFAYETSHHAWFWSPQRQGPVISHI